MVQGQVDVLAKEVGEISESHVSKFGTVGNPRLPTALPLLLSHNAKDAMARLLEKADLALPRIQFPVPRFLHRNRRYKLFRRRFLAAAEQYR